MKLSIKVIGEYDLEKDTLYISVPNADKATATKQINDTTFADVDKTGKVVGLEILFYSRIAKKSKNG